MYKKTNSLNINDIHFDSRKVKQGSVFVAISGTVSDGHDYIEKAIAQGAIACVKIARRR